MLTYISLFLLFYQTKILNEKDQQKQGKKTIIHQLLNKTSLWCVEKPTESFERGKLSEPQTSPANFLSGQERSHEDCAALKSPMCVTDFEALAELPWRSEEKGSKTLQAEHL